MTIKDIFLGVGFLTLLFLAITFLVKVDKYEQEHHIQQALQGFRQDAVDAGHAEWVVGPNNEPEFRWKEPCSQ